MKNEAAEKFKFGHRLAPLKILTNSSFSKKDVLLGDLSKQYHATKIDAFDFLHDLFQNEKFSYLFHHQMTINEKKMLQFICRQFEVNRDSFKEMLPVLLKNELIFFEQYVHHVNQNYSKVRFNDPLIKKKDPSMSSENEGQSVQSEEESEKGENESDAGEASSSQDKTPKDTLETNQINSEEGNSTDIKEVDTVSKQKESLLNKRPQIESLKIDKFQEKVFDTKKKYEYEMQHDDFILEKEDAMWAGVASFYIRLLKFRLSLNDCQNQGFILLNIEKLFCGLDLGHFFYTHPLLSVSSDTLHNPFATLLYSLQDKSIKHGFFLRNTERSNLITWDNFDIITIAFQYFKIQRKIKSLNNLKIDEFFDFLKRFFVPKNLIVQATESSSSKFQENDENSHNPNEDADFKNENSYEMESNNREESPTDSTREVTQEKKETVKNNRLMQNFAEVADLFKIDDFQNFAENIKRCNMGEFMDLNLEHEDKDRVSEIGFLQDLIYSNLEFAQMMKIWGDELEQTNEISKLLRDLHSGDKSENGREPTVTKRGGMVEHVINNLDNMADDSHSDSQVFYLACFDVLRTRAFFVFLLLNCFLIIFAYFLFKQVENNCKDNTTTRSKNKSVIESFRKRKPNKTSSTRSTKRKEISQSETKRSCISESCDPSSTSESPSSPETFSW